MSGQHRLRVSLVLPIVACVIMVASDYLIGFVTPGAIGQYGLVQSGWSEVAPWRPALSLFLAAIAFPLYLVGLQAISRRIAETDPKVARTFLSLSVGSSLGWLFIHAIFCIPQLAYKFIHDAGHPDLALALTDKIFFMFTPVIVVCLLWGTAAFGYLLVAILRKKTPYARGVALLNPLVAMVLMILARALFSGSIWVFSTSLGMLNWGMLSFFIAAAAFEYKLV